MNSPQSVENGCDLPPKPHIELEQQILTQLQELNANFDALKNDFSELKDEVQTTNHILTGNGNPAQGFVVRGDRLEIAAERRSFWTRSGVWAAIAALSGIAWLVVKSFH